MSDKITAEPKVDSMAGSETPFQIHVYVCGIDCGCYSFETQAEADEDYEYRQKFKVLGCWYRKEYPNEQDQRRA